MNKELYKIYLNNLLSFLKERKTEIEAVGRIATIDEVIEGFEKEIERNN